MDLKKQAEVNKRGFYCPACGKFLNKIIGKFCDVNGGYIKVWCPRCKKIGRIRLLKRKIIIDFSTIRANLSSGVNNG